MRKHLGAPYDHAAIVQRRSGAAPLRPRLGQDGRLHAAHPLSRGHVLRDLGLAREKPARLGHNRAPDDAELAMAAIVAVLGLRRRHRLLAGAPRLGRLSKVALDPPAHSAALWHARDRSPAVLPPGD